MADFFVESSKQPDWLQKMSFVHPQDNRETEVRIDGYKLPGIIDVHFHGAFGWDFAFGNTDEIEKMLDQLLASGITGLFPTLITCPEEQRLKALADIAAVAKRRKHLPTLHGIYLEGPFLAPAKKGSHPESCLALPSMELLERWQKAAGGLIKIITVAPELPGALEFITAATRSGVTVALGHSNADWETTKKAIAAGARHVTHLFNAMPVFNHRQPNMLSYLLANRDLYVELIGDCEHLAPEIVKFIFELYEAGQIILVSDAVAPTGLADGNYSFYGEQLVKTRNRCCLCGGNLFGGATLLSACMPRLVDKAGISWGLAGAATWRNPCRQFKIQPPETEVYFDSAMNWLATRFGKNKWYTRP